jgi:hypothetical protein
VGAVQVQGRRSNDVGKVGLEMSFNVYIRSHVDPRVAFNFGSKERFE